MANRTPLKLASGQIQQFQAGDTVDPTFLPATGSGTVTSVDVAVPAEFTSTGGPVTTSGVITIGKNNQNANLVYSGPVSGGAAAPTFRALVAADMSALLSVINTWSQIQTFTTGIKLPDALTSTAAPNRPIGVNAVDSKVRMMPFVRREIAFFEGETVKRIVIPVSNIISNTGRVVAVVQRPNYIEDDDPGYQYLVTIERSSAVVVAIVSAVDLDGEQLLDSPDELVELVLFHDSGSVGDLPTISAQADISFPTNSDSGFLTFTVGTTKSGGAASLGFSAYAETNSGIFSSIGVGGSGASRLLLLEALTGKQGVARVVATVTDADGETVATSFRVTVT